MRNSVLIPFVLSFFIFMSVASATSIYVDPPMVGEGLTEGDTFYIDINIEGVKDLYSYELKLRYDTTLLDVGNINPSPFLNEPTEPIKRMIDDEKGFLWFAVSSLHPAEPKSGSGTLATITFRVKGRGRCDLSLYETLLTDSDVRLIEHSMKDAIFDNSEVGVPKQTLSLIVTVSILIVIIFLVRKKPKKRKK